jgi:hypothetical protein
MEQQVDFVANREGVSLHSAFAFSAKSFSASSRSFGDMGVVSKPPNVTRRLRWRFAGVVQF